MEKEEYIRLSKEHYEIYEWIRNNNWKINKHALGEWSNDDSRWIEYLTQRAERRKEQDEILELL